MTFENRITKLSGTMAKAFAKAGLPATHAIGMTIDNSKYESLCGTVAKMRTYYMEGKFKDTFSRLEDRVDCPDCKAHRHWDLWVCNRVSA